MSVGILISILAALLPALLSALPGTSMWRSLHAWLLKATNAEVTLTFLDVRTYSARSSHGSACNLWESLLKDLGASERLTIRARSDEALFIHSHKLGLNPNPPKDTDGRREDSGRGWVRELQGRWPGVLG